jgi:hypothetical protein
MSPRFKSRNFPKGYAEMLERQQTQLVSCVQELYQRLRTAGLWEGSLTDGSDRCPLVYDILAALDLLEPRSDGSGELETFNDVARASLPGHDHASQGSDSAQDAYKQYDGDIEQIKSPTLPHDDADSVFPKTSALSNRSRASSISLPALYQTFQRTSELLRRRSTYPEFAQRPSTQAQTGCDSSQAHLFVTFATPTDRSYLNAPNDFLQNNATTPSMFTESLTIGRGSSSQAVVPLTNQPPLWHGWVERGIGFDSSDFLTDFYVLSPLFRAKPGVRTSSQCQNIP